VSSNNSATVDKYLEVIFYIAAEGEVVRPGKIAAWLLVSPPTVSEAMRRLERDGWIEIHHDRSVTLTSKGTEVASNLVRHHRILERWLTDVLGLDWASADDEAERLSSAVSDFLIDRIDASLQRPLTCPHGNPIPGREAAYGELAALATLGTGTRANVRRISEVAEHEAKDLLTMLTANDISEGSSIEVVASPEETSEIELVVEGRHVVLPRAAAQLIWVELAA
jgi:DtxR family Mn-dependent transcriptional regulator